MTNAKLRSIQVGTSEIYGTHGAEDPMDRPWETAFCKEPVDSEVSLGETNLDGTDRLTSDITVVPKRPSASIQSNITPIGKKNWARARSSSV